MTNQRDRVWNWLERSPHRANAVLMSAGVALTVLVVHLVLGGTDVVALMCTLAAALPLYARVAAPVTAFVGFSAIAALALAGFGVTLMALSFWAIPCLVYTVASRRSRPIAAVVLVSAMVGCLVMGLTVGQWYVVSFDELADFTQWYHVLLVFCLAGAVFPLLGYATGRMARQESRMERLYHAALPLARA